MITDRERQTYDDLWTSVPAYGAHSPGAEALPLFLAMSGATAGQRVLDAGCGSGQAGVALGEAGFLVQLVDLTDAGLTDAAQALPFYRACLWKDPLPVTEWVYCCDVLEHVPTEYTMLTVARLLTAGARGVFVSMALVPDQFGAWVGTPLHQTVRDYTWWRDRLAELGTVVDARDLGPSAVFLVVPS